ALTGEARSATAREHGRAEAPADGHGRDHVVRVARDDDADRHLAVVRPVGGVECAAPGVEADLAAHGAPERCGERGGIERRAAGGRAAARRGLPGPDARLACGLHAGSMTDGPPRPHPTRGGRTRRPIATAVGRPATGPARGAGSKPAARRLPALAPRLLVPPRVSWRPVHGGPV